MRKATICIAALLLAAQGQAAQVFYGEDINTTATGQNEDAVRIAHPQADAARAAYLAGIAMPATEDFESFADDDFVSSINFAGVAATLSPALPLFVLPTGNFNGTYPTSGDTFALMNSFSEDFTLSFSTPQTAFGLYITDNEVPGNLALRFTLANGGTIDRLVPTQVNPTPATNHTGSVAYWGVIDNDNPFTRVSFVRAANVADGYGLDDITIALATPAVPEPESLALMGLGLAWLAWLAGTRRRGPGQLDGDGLKRPWARRHNWGPH